MWILTIGLCAAAAAFVYGAYCLFRVSPVKEKRHNGLPAVLCIGDSITFGAGVVKTRKKDCWVRRLEVLGEGKYQTLNYGISGTTLLRDGDHPYRKMKFLEAAKKQRPEVVILLLGSNDSKSYNWNAPNYRRELKEMIEEIKGWDSTKQLYVMTPPDCCPVKPGEAVMFDIQQEVIREEIYPIVTELASIENVNLIDLYTLTLNHPEYFADGVHPNERGNMAIAEHISKVLQ